MKSVKNILNFIKKHPVESFFTLIAFIILFYNLMIDPIIGKTDNGDFGKMYSFAGLSDLGTTYEEIYDGFLHTKYKFNIFGFLLPWNIDFAFGNFIAKFSNILFLPFKLLGMGYYDIRFLGILYIILFLVALFLVLKYKEFKIVHKIIIGIFALVFFTDIHYITYFNSFFGEATVITFFFLMIASYLMLIEKKEFTKNNLRFFYISAIGFLTSKTQEIPLLVFMILVFIGMYKLSNSTDAKKLIKKYSFLTFIFCALVYVSIGSHTNINNKYQMIFTGILKGSENPKEDLIELGLDPKYAPLAGSGYYDQDLPIDPQSDDMMENFYPKVSVFKALGYYLKHPSRIYEKMNNSANHAYSVYKLSKANFEKGKYDENKKVNSIRTNLAFKYHGLHRSLPLYLIFSFIYILICAYYFFKSKDTRTRLMTLICLFIMASGLSNLFLPVLGSGEADFGKHLFLLSLTYDSMLCIALLYIINRFIKLFKRR